MVIHNNPKLKSIAKELVHTSMGLNYFSILKELSIRNIEAAYKIISELDSRDLIPDIIPMGFVNIQHTPSRTLIRSAIEKENKEVVKFLIERGAHIKPTNTNGNTLLDTAFKHQNAEIGRLLIEKKGDILPNGTTMLHYACDRQDTAFAKFLIECGASVDASLSNGVTPLKIAIYHQNIEIGRLLIENKGDILPNGLTLLHLTCANNDLEVAKFLIECGADIHAVTPNGSTPLMIAELNDHKAIVELIQQKAFNDFAHALAQDPMDDATPMDNVTPMDDLLLGDGIQ